MKNIGFMILVSLAAACTHATEDSANNATCDFPAGFCSVKSQHGCAEGEACYPTWGTEYGYCAPEGYGLEGTPCHDNGDSDCAIGYSCAGTCAKICFDADDCATGEHCEIPDGGAYTDYGMCM